ncbi:MAG TPA: PAS domain S-box protein [Gallionella sp.]|nr:PAS domain S-box protein [Gallionella sp.]
MTDTESPVTLRLLDEVFCDVSVVFYIADAAGDFTLRQVSRNIERVLGLSLSACVGSPSFWRDRIHPEDIESMLREIGEMGEAKACVQEYRLRDESNDYRWVRNEVALRCDESGSARYLAGCLRDISAEKARCVEFARYEEMQHAREHFYRSVLDSLPQRLFWKDRNSVFRGCNRQGANALGLNGTDEIVGKSDYDFYQDREEADYLRIHDEQVMDSGQASYHTEVSIREGDIWLDVSKVPLTDENGKVYGLLVSYENVSALKKSEMALNKFKRAVEQSYNSVIITDTAGRIEYVNPMFLKAYGYEEHEVVGQMPNLLKSGLVPAEIYRELWQSILSGQHWRGELANRKRNGEVSWQSVSISPITDESGAITHFLAIEDDITEHKLLEADLKRQLKFIQTLIDALPHPVYFKDCDGHYQRVNHAFEEFFGLKVGEGIGKTAFDVFPEDVASMLKVADKHLLKHGGAEMIEYTVTGRDGKLRNIMSHKAAYLNEHGEVSGIIGSHFDISERKRVEAALAENEARLRELTSTVGEGIYVVNAEQLITFANPAAVNLLGWSEQELLGRNVHSLFNCPGYANTGEPDTEPCCMAELIRKLPRTVRNENESFLRKDGTPFPVSVIASPIIREDRYAGAVVAFHDIAEQKFTQSLLNNALQELRTVLDNAQIGVAYLRNDNFSWINRHMEQMFGYTADELRQESIGVLCGTGNRKESNSIITLAMSTLHKGQAYESEFKMKRRSGEVFWCHLRGVAIDPGSPASGSIWIVLDIDRLKKTERRLKVLNEGLAQQVEEETRKSLEKERLLIQQGRNAAMGEMIGNIAHQWRQPLSTLGLVVQNIHSDYREGGLDEQALDTYVDTATRAIQRMSCTIDDFRDFFRPSRVSESFSVYQSIQEAIQLLDAMLKNNGISTGLIGDTTLRAFGHANEFSQVILNFMVNAKDALVEKKAAKGHIDIQLSASDERAVVTIGDNAGGIDEGLMERIFDPYFTTKASGTGIGLYMCKIIIEQHMNGGISCRNLFEGDKRSGVEFTITIPLPSNEKDSRCEVMKCAN